jgi:hypothetical protein
MDFSSFTNSVMLIKTTADEAAVSQTKFNTDFGTLTLMVFMVNLFVGYVF